jgi:hypothetical protein
MSTRVEIQQGFCALPTLGENACPVKRNNPLTMPVNGLQKGWLMGLEPTTSRSTIVDDSILSVNQQGLTSTTLDACTSVCTTDDVTDDTESLVRVRPAIAAALTAASLQRQTEGIEPSSKTRDRRRSLEAVAQKARQSFLTPVRFLSRITHVTPYVMCSHPVRARFSREGMIIPDSFPSISSPKPPSKNNFHLSSADLSRNHKRTCVKTRS